MSIRLVQERVAKGIFQRQQFGDDVVAEGYFMERAPSPVVVVADAQPGLPGFGDDQAAQGFDLDRFALVRRVAEAFS